MRHARRRATLGRAPPAALRRGSGSLSLGCGLPPTAPAPPAAPAAAAAAAALRVVVVRRSNGGAAPTRRNFAHLSSLVGALRRCAAVGSVEVREPSGALTMCEQVRLYATAVDAVLSPSGAHNTNGVFLPPGALLVEGMPWANMMLAYFGLLRRSRLAHEVVYSARPPAADYEYVGDDGGRGTELTDVACGKRKECRYGYRYGAEVYVDERVVCALLGEHRRRRERGATAHLEPLPLRNFSRERVHRCDRGPLVR